MDCTGFGFSAMEAGSCTPQEGMLEVNGDLSDMLCYTETTDGFLLSRKISSFHRPQKVFCKMSLSTSLGAALLHQHWCTRDPVHPLPSFRDLCWFNACCAYFTGEIFHLLLLNVTLHFCFTTGSTRSYWPPGSNWSARPSCEYCQQESCFLP